MRIMRISVGGKFVLTKNTRFLEEGTVVTVTKIDNNDVIHFVFGEDNNGGNGYMDADTFREHFKKVEDETSKAAASSIREECLEEILENSDIEVFTTFDKCIIMSCRLPNGFVITESYTFANPEDYDEDMGFDICYNKILDKICELEAYKIQDALYTSNINRKESDECDRTCNGCCEDCDYN